ncbi:hypothetical protein AcetOrient_orf03019 [Acetobacter orientalis]|uniref:Uncharacterized protein n=1 Tax=Acetobacter orientalis TaxID=146474 RepID=A0A2Z5ZHY6_9PROT|nr:hypothetical protein AcetOrient_orf03019 [Acetobacter orientalis]
MTVHNVKGLQAYFIRTLAALWRSILTIKANKTHSSNAKRAEHHQLKQL